MADAVAERVGVPTAVWLCDTDRVCVVERVALAVRVSVRDTLCDRDCVRVPLGVRVEVSVEAPASQATRSAATIAASECIVEQTIGVRGGGR